MHSHTYSHTRTYSHIHTKYANTHMWIQTHTNPLTYTLRARSKRVKNTRRENPLKKRKEKDNEVTAAWPSLWHFRHIARHVAAAVVTHAQ